MFHVGQHVVCVDLRPNKRGFFPRYSDTVIPVLRGIYTVRRIFDAKRYGYDAAGVLLTVFKAMLQPVPTREVKESVDA